METCAPLPSDAGFIRSILAFLDCQAQTLGASGYQALAGPNSTLAVLLTGFLTLFIALIGYRMLLGESLSLRAGVLAFVKIGIVLALATSWPAYRTLVYDVALKGPVELAGEIGAPTGLPGAGGGLVARLDGADQAFVVLSVLGEGRPPVPVDANQASAMPDVPPQPYPGFNTLAIGGARMLFLIGAIAGLGAVRLIAGLLLAVGPFFAGFLLFDNTRALFEGWVRVLAGAALAALGTAIALGVELALLEPWLADLLARRGADEWLPGMPVEILVVTSAFLLIVGAMLYASARIAWGFRLAPLWRAAAAGVGATIRGDEVRTAMAGAAGAAGAPPAEARSRAATVVDAVAATQRREADPATAAPRGLQGRASPAGAGTSPAAAARNAAPPSAPPPLGQSFRRRTRGRVSASAGRRDHRS